MLRTTRESQIEQQPASLDGKLWITADARIDCREELEKKLALQGYSAAGRSVTDSGLILRAYAAWGAECVQHLRGDFAFAIWDARKKLLFCARDHFGVKPFYYSELGELFLFSNTLDCLRQHPGVSDELNDAAIGDFLLFGLNCDAATTTFRDIRRLPAAHAMTVSSDGLRIQRYWSAPTTGRIRYQRAEDYVEHFQILLQAAVTDRMRVDRAGILLSGGLDSATVATTVRELAAGPGGTTDLRAYTVVYESLIPDQDGRYAREVADFLNIPHQTIPIDRLQPFERWDEPGIRSPEPVDDPFFAGLFDQFRTIAADCRVVLSGEGADNLMHFEMWPFARALMRERQWASLFRESSRYLSLRPSIRSRAKASRTGSFRKRSHCAGVSGLAGTRLCASSEPAGPVQGMERASGRAPSPDSSQGARITLFTALVFHVRAGKCRSDALPGRGAASLFGFADREFPAGASALSIIFRKAAFARGSGGTIA